MATSSVTTVRTGPRLSTEIIAQRKMQLQVQELYWCRHAAWSMLKDAMKSHAQYCPVARAAEILNQKWTLLIFRDLFAGASRFNELRRGVPRMSPTLLSQRLKHLESLGLIERRVAHETGVVEYLPTPAGLEVKPIVELYGVWGQRWVRNRLGEDELDVSLLMWAMRCGIDRGHFPGERSVVRIEFTDRPRLKKGN